MYTCAMKNARIEEFAVRRRLPPEIRNVSPIGATDWRRSTGRQGWPQRCGRNEVETAIARKIRSNSATSSPSGKLLGTDTSSCSMRRHAGNGERNILPRARGDGGRGGRERWRDEGSRRPPPTSRLYSIYYWSQDASVSRSPRHDCLNVTRINRRRFAYMIYIYMYRDGIFFSRFASDSLTAARCPPEDVGDVRVGCDSLTGA